MDVRASTSFRREPAAVPAARAFVRHAVRSAGAAPETVDRLVLAAAEAFNNAILHAAGDTFGVRIMIDSRSCTVMVTDAGRGFQPPAHPRMPAADDTGHRGLAIMEALVDEVDVRSSPAGTRVVLVQSLLDDARLLADF
ncbi:MAG TPA: ATP-binding protein [Acidimicrobiales bacterium]